MRGCIFGHIFGSSKNDPKNIGICPESVISHLGIIKTPKNSNDTLKNKEKTKNHVISVAIFWALLDPGLGPTESSVVNMLILGSSTAIHMAFQSLQNGINQLIHGINQLKMKEHWET